MLVLKKNVHKSCQKGHKSSFKKGLEKGGRIPELQTTGINCKIMAPISTTLIVGKLLRVVAKLTSIVATRTILRNQWHKIVVAIFSQNGLKQRGTHREYP